MNKFEVIYDKSELKRVIDFLGDGFGLSQALREAFFNVLLKNPPHFPIAAITSQNGKITAAMLLIAQMPSSTAESKILNMSTWYALPEFRGIEPIIFIKKLIKQLNEYTFTDYTANDAASAVLQSMGFSKMKVHKFICGFSRQKLFRYESNFALNYFNKSGQKFLPNLKSLNALSDNSIKSESPFYWIISTKKYFLKLRLLHIFIENPLAFKFPNLISVFWMMLRFRVISISFYLYSEQDSSDFQNSPWLMKCNDINFKFLSPLKSEISVLSQEK